MTANPEDVDLRLEPYAYLWQSPHEYRLFELPVPFQGHKYGIVRLSTLRVWSENLELYDRIVDAMINAGVVVLSLDEFNELRLEEYRSLWEDSKDQYELIEFKGWHSIHHIKSGASLRMEDERLGDMLVSRMIAAGVKIVKRE